MVRKKDLVESGQLTDDDEDQEDEQDPDTTQKGHIWKPVCTDP